MADKKTDSKSDRIEREYTIPLRREWRKVPRYKRTNKAIKAIKEFLARHMRIRSRDLNRIKIDKFLNELMWSRGIKHPATKVKVKAVKESGSDIVKVELAEIPASMKFKKERIEKRNQKAREAVESKKSAMEKLREAASGKKETQKTESAVSETAEEAEKQKEKEEKKASVVEAEEKLEKEISKAEKRTAKAKSPKQQKNMQTGYNAVSRGR